MPYSGRLTFFIVLCVFCALVFLGLFFYRPLKGWLIRRNVTKFYYHRVMREARIHDYYLVNDIRYKLGGSDYVYIDHVLGGDKYIYVITDVYYEGAITARNDDAHWVNYLKNGKKIKINNPLMLSKVAVDRFSKASGINTSFLVGVVLVNDDCFVTPFENHRGEPVFVALSRLGKVISAYEKDDISPFVGTELKNAMIALHEEKEKEYAKKRKQ